MAAKPEVTGLATPNVQGLAGTTSLMQTSPDLAIWTDTQSVHFTGLRQPATDQGTPAEPCRFFRLQSP